jgi:hypothetical protein
MNWREAAATLQLLAEERFGAPRKLAARQAKAEEDALADANRQGLKP